MIRVGWWRLPTNDMRPRDSLPEWASNMGGSSSASREIMTHHLLRQRLLARAGLSDLNPKLTLADLERSEWSPEFEILMRNRLIMGALRYGKLGVKPKQKYDRVNSIAIRLRKYQETGNLELLVDIANLCLCEFVEGTHPLRHWHAVDDGQHVACIGNTK